MTKTPTIQTLLLLLLALLTACNDPKPLTDALHRAEMLMNEHPDSALAVLNTLSPDAMGKNRTRAHYALLYTQAQDKNYIDETNDSLITVATDYYRHTDDVRRKFLSHYYKGRVLGNAGNYLDATSCYMEAEQLVDAVGDDYLVGLLYAEMGRIYRLYYDYPKSLEAYQKAAECYERAGKIRHRNYMWYNQSSILRNMNESEDSERLLRMILELTEKDNDISLVKSCLGSLVMQYVEDNRMAEARSIYAVLESVSSNDSASPALMGALAEMYVSEGDLHRAEKCLEKGWERAESGTDSINLYVASSELYSRQGRNDLAYQELLKAMTLQNEEAKQALQQPVLTVQRDYLSEKLAFEVYRVQMEKRLRVLYVLLASFVLAIVVYVLCRKLKVEKEKARRTIDELNHEMLKRDKESRDKIASLLDEMEDKDKTSSASIHNLRSELRKQEEDYRQCIKEAEELQHRMEAELSRKTVFVAELFKNWFASMSKMLLVLVQNAGKEDAKNKKLLKEVMLWQEKYYEGNKAYREVEKLVNRYNDDAMTYFRQEIVWSEEVDYRRVCYFFAGFSIRLIAVLMKESEDAVYQKRHRLRKNLEASDLPHKDLFLVLLDK